MFAAVAGVFSLVKGILLTSIEVLDLPATRLPFSVWHQCEDSATPSADKRDQSSAKIHPKSH
jgi:hypothetical protein